MKGQRRLYEPQEAPARPCGLCGTAATHEASWRRATWVQVIDLCQPCSSLAVAGGDPPYKLRRFVPVPPRPALEPEPTLPLDI